MTFVLDRAGAAEVLKFIAAEEVSAIAAQVAAAAGPEASTETKPSKSRFVARVKVPDVLQATDGVLSKAASGLGLKINQYAKPEKTTTRKPGFASRVQWRWAFWSAQPWARPKARETPGEKLIRYRQLPERAGSTKTTPTGTPRKRGWPRKNPTT